MKISDYVLALAGTVLLWWVCSTINTDKMTIELKEIVIHGHSSIN